MEKVMAQYITVENGELVTKDEDRVELFEYEAMVSYIVYHQAGYTVVTRVALNANYEPDPACAKDSTVAFFKPEEDWKDWIRTDLEKIEDRQLLEEYYADHEEEEEGAYEEVSLSDLDLDDIWRDEDHVAAGKVQ